MSFFIIFLLSIQIIILPTGCFCKDKRSLLNLFNHQDIYSKSFLPLHPLRHLFFSILPSPLSLFFSILPSSLSSLFFSIPSHSSSTLSSSTLFFSTIPSHSSSTLFSPHTPSLHNSFLHFSSIFFNEVNMRKVESGLSAMSW